MSVAFLVVLHQMELFAALKRLTAQGYLIVAVLVGVFCFRTRREPLGPVALAASVVLIGLAVLIHWMPDGGSEVVLFLLPLWVVASSTVAGVLLLPLVRRWEAERHAV